MKTSVIEGSSPRGLAREELQPGQMYKDGSGDIFVVGGDSGGVDGRAIFLRSQCSDEPFVYPVSQLIGPFSPLPAGTSVTFTQE